MEYLFYLHRSYHCRRWNNVYWFEGLTNYDISCKICCRMTTEYRASPFVVNNTLFYMIGKDVLFLLLIIYEVSCLAFFNIPLPTTFRMCYETTMHYVKYPHHNKSNILLLIYLYSYFTTLLGSNKTSRNAGSYQIMCHKDWFRNDAFFMILLFVMIGWDKFK